MRPIFLNSLYKRLEGKLVCVSGRHLSTADRLLFDPYVVFFHGMSIRVSPAVMTTWPDHSSALYAHYHLACRRAPSPPLGQPARHAIGIAADKCQPAPPGYEPDCGWDRYEEAMEGRLFMDEQEVVVRPSIRRAFALGPDVFCAELDEEGEVLTIRPRYEGEVAPPAVSLDSNNARLTLGDAKAAVRLALA